MSARRPPRPAKLRRDGAQSKSERVNRSGLGAAKVPKVAAATSGKRDRSRPAGGFRSSRRVSDSTRTQAARDEARQRRLIRLAVAAVAVVICIFGLAQPLHRWWAQQREYATISSEVEAVREANDELRVQRDRWSDKDYIASQARARLQMVMPGETQYTVVDPGPGNDTSVLGAKPARPQGPPRPWYLVVADSVQAAGDPHPIDVLVPTVTPTEDSEE